MSVYTLQSQPSVFQTNPIHSPAWGISPSNYDGQLLELDSRQIDPRHFGPAHFDPNSGLHVDRNAGRHHSENLDRDQFSSATQFDGGHVSMDHATFLPVPVRMHFGFVFGSFCISWCIWCVVQYSVVHCSALWSVDELKRFVFGSFCISWCIWCVVQYSGVHCSALWSVDQLKRSSLYFKREIWTTYYFSYYY